MRPNCAPSCRLPPSVSAIPLALCLIGAQRASGFPEWPQGSRWRAMTTGLMFDGYDPQQFYCELLRCPAATAVRDRLSQQPVVDFARRAAAAEQALYNFGITFTVYSEESAI